MAAAISSPARRALAAAFVLGTAGCASSPQLAAQWTDPQLGPQSAFLRGSRVLVACDVADVTVRQLCQDQVAAEVSARGATPLFPGPETVIATDRSIDGQLLAAARSYRGSSSVGVGVAAPVGPGRVIMGYAANGRITDVGTGRLVWSASASTAPSSELEVQLGALSKTVFGAADKSGLF